MIFRDEMTRCIFRRFTSFARFVLFTLCAVFFWPIVRINPLQLCPCSCLFVLFFAVFSL